MKQFFCLTIVVFILAGQMCDACTVNVCDLPAVTGMCRAYFLRYHYNKESGLCEQFVYGGCDGNGNNFETQSECEIACSNGDYGSGFYIYAKPLHEPLLHHLIFFLPLIVSFYAT